jgi:hypothetical protein
VKHSARAWCTMGGLAEQRARGRWTGPVALVACFSLSLSAMYLHVMQDAQFEVRVMPALTSDSDIPPSGITLHRRQERESLQFKPPKLGSRPPLPCTRGAGGSVRMIHW